MYRVISTKIKQSLVTVLTKELDIKEFFVSPLIEKKNQFQVGDIVIGRITNIIKNINSIFVEIAPGVEGYLKEKSDTELIYTNGKISGKPNINDTILVQIAKEPSKSKSYTLVTDFTFINQYFLLKTELKKILFSSKLKEEAHFQKIKQRLTKIGESFFEKTGMGFIIRKSAMTISDEEFLESLNQLYENYRFVIKRGLHGVQYEKIYQDLPPYLRLVRDYHSEIEKIMTDEALLYEEYLSYLSKVSPGLKDSLFFYQDDKMKLVNLYSMETRLERALSKKVWLDSGAYLVIEPTEALTVIDVNSGKAIAGKSLKTDTFLKINIEAAKEIAKQIRLRNISGIIIIDFIEIPQNKYKELIHTMNEALKEDSITTSVAGMTKLGLMEITRRRIGKPLHEYRDFI